MVESIDPESLNIGDVFMHTYAGILTNIGPFLVVKEDIDGIIEISKEKIIQTYNDGTLFFCKS